VKASAFRRWPVTAPYRGEQTTRLTGGHDLGAFEGCESLRNRRGLDSPEILFFRII